MKFKIKLKRILVLMMIFSLIYPHLVVMAAVELEAARNALVSYAVNFQKNHGTEVYYYLPGSFKYRNAAYTDNTKYNPNTFTIDNGESGKYLLDCVGWVNYCVHNALKLDCGASGENDKCFVAPPGGNNKDYFEFHSSSDLSGAKPGDIIVSAEHVMILTAEDEIVHSESTAGLSKNSFSASYYSGELRGYYSLTDTALQQIDKSDLDYGGDPVGTGSGKGVGRGTLAVNMADFYYNGIPDGKYSVTKGLLERIIDALKAIFAFLVTLLVNIIRMVFVGWTAIIEKFITSTIKSVAGDDNIEMISPTDPNVDSGDNVTVEKIVFNQITLFDVNFFNYNEEIKTAEEAAMEQELEDALRK